MKLEDMGIHVSGHVLFVREMLYRLVDGLAKVMADRNHHVERIAKYVDAACRYLHCVERYTA